MARTKKAAVVEVDDDLDELEELEEEPAPKKAKKAAPKKAARRVAAENDEESSAYGASWLAEHINEQTGKEYSSANIRTLLRKLARAGELDRAIGEDRGRYEFAGPNDPIVKAVLKAVKEGAVEKEKTERLAAVKDKKKASKAKAAPEPDEDEDEDEDETPAPRKKATRRR